MIPLHDNKSIDKWKINMINENWSMHSQIIKFRHFQVLTYLWEILCDEKVIPLNYSYESQTHYFKITNVECNVEYYVI